VSEIAKLAIGTELVFVRGTFHTPSGAIEHERVGTRCRLARRFRAGHVSVRYPGDFGEVVTTIRADDVAATLALPSAQPAPTRDKPAISAELARLARFGARLLAGDHLDEIIAAGVRLRPRKTPRKVHPPKLASAAPELVRLVKNRMLGRGDFYEYTPFPWRGELEHGLVPIGTNGAGDHWLVDAPTARVYRLDHETAKLALAHYSISELVYVNVFCRGAFPYSEDRWDARVRAFRARARSNPRARLV
jgi:hypothetical protein